jgi:ATP-dependent DNA helicase DinG
MQSSVDLLGPTGPFASQVDGFLVRAEQCAMAAEVEDAIQARSTLLLEAGTGTGKTLAYLCPAIVSGKRVIVSTGTKNLQDQLFHRDLPLAQRVLGRPLRVALLKGRGSYVCIQRLLSFMGSGNVDDRTDAKLAAIHAWAASDETGDVARCPGVAESDPAWRFATSSIDTCLGQQCPELTACHVFGARREALGADLLVVNHHLYCAALAMRSDALADLLPRADAVIIDEAHLLPDIASDLMGVTLSSRETNDLVRDVNIAYRTEAGDDRALEELAARVQYCLREFRLAFATTSGRVLWSEAKRDTDVEDALNTLVGSLQALAEHLQDCAERSVSLEQCARRAVGQLQRLTSLADADISTRHVAWLELRSLGFVWRLSPLEPPDTLSAELQSDSCAHILTSATLAVNGAMTHFARRLGLDEYDERILESPFDLANQALCYVPEHMPEPSAQDYTLHAVQVARQVLAISRGRAFFLFTSHRALQCAAEALADLELPLLVQGSASRDVLLREFREIGNAVLLGTSSFWEGVDVRGEALCCVIIDKLPFAAPTDPLMQARLGAYAERGLDPFTSYQLPQAIIALKQGVGRLIRDVDDYGVVVLCDPRVFSKRYGRAFREAIAPMPVTRGLTEVERLFERANAPRSETGRLVVHASGEGA